MKITITAGLVTNARGAAARGDHVDWPEYTARPLVDSGAAVEGWVELDGEDESEAAEAEGVRATPEAKELAGEAGLDLLEIEGSGEEGRVLKADVETAIEAEES